MPRFAPVVWLVGAGLLAAGSPAAAQDGQQKAVATANMRKAELGRPAILETDNFIVATTLPEEKAKALGAVLEKVVPVARTALQFEEKEQPWKGKLAVYVLPEGRDFKSFMRSVVVAQPESVHYDLGSDNPLVVDPVDVPAKATEADQIAHTAAIVAGAYLRARAGTANVPDWLADGFGRVTVMRAEGPNSRQYAAYRAAARRLAARGVKGSDLWAETRPAEADVLATSLAEFLAYGPKGGDFPKLLAGFRPGEAGNTPAVQQALEAGGWKDAAMLDAAWRRWVSVGK